MMEVEDPFEARGIWDDTGDIPVLKLQFDTNDPEFARGVQIGMVWQLLHGEVEEFEMPLYLTNAEMVFRMCEATGYTFTAKYENDEEVDDDADWIMVTFTSK